MRSSLYRLPAFKAALACARLFPRSWLQRLAPTIGLASYARNAAVQVALRANLHRITGKSEAALAALCKENVSAFSRMLADYFLCVAGSGRSASALLAEWRGVEHIEAALSRGNGAIIITAHLGNWELGGVLLALRGIPMTVITLDEPSTELTRWRDQYRQRLGIRTITVGPGHDFTFVEMIQTLRRNECLAMLVDRPYAGTGSPVTFFGRQTEFSSAPALLWQHTGAAIIPAFVLQNPAGKYVSFADPALPLESGGNTRESLIENTQRIATHFEAVIRQHPEQWFNYVPIWKQNEN